MTKTEQRQIVKDVRRLSKWIEEAINRGDKEGVQQYAIQLSATALQLDESGEL